MSLLVPRWWTDLLNGCQSSVLQRELSCAASQISTMRQDDRYRLALAWARAEGPVPPISELTRGTQARIRANRILMNSHETVYVRGDGCDVRDAVDMNSVIDISDMPTIRPRRVDFGHVSPSVHVICAYCGVASGPENHAQLRLCPCTCMPYCSRRCEEQDTSHRDACMDRVRDAQTIVQKFRSKHTWPFCAARCSEDRSIPIDMGTALALTSPGSSTLLQGLTDREREVIDLHPALVNSELQDEIKRDRLVSQTRDIAEVNKSDSHAKLRQILRKQLQWDVPSVR